MKFNCFVLAAACSLLVSQSQNSYVLAAARNVRDINSVLSLADSTIQAPDFIVDDENGRLTCAISIENELWQIELRKHSLRGDSFQLLVRYEPNGPYEAVEPPPVHTYKGTVVGREDVHVRGSFVDGELTAMIFAGEETYAVQPIRPLLANAGDGAHVVYRHSDWINERGYRCGNDDGPPDGHLHDLDPLDGEGGVAGTGLKVTDIGIEADFEYYQLNGSSVNSTLIDMETVMNAIEAIYEAPTTAITYEITTALVDAVSPSDYTSVDPGTRLCEFRSRWLASPQSNIQRDVAHLFTGANLIDPVIGIAGTFGGICNVAGAAPQCTASGNHGFCIAQSRFTSNFSSRVALSAHELGHLWGAFHCNNCASCSNCCRIMCSGLGGCTGIISSFGCEEVGQILSHKNSRSCLADLADPQALPFFDDFPTTTLSTAKWSYNNGALINNSASNEISGSNSLNLDASGTTSFLDDDIRTNFILLGGQSQGAVSYYTQHVGVESGEQFVVEYFGTNMLWNELNRITSNGTNQTTFNLHSHALPGNALHNEFRLRFRPEVNESNDEWYIENVSVTANSPAQISLHPESVNVCQGTPAAFQVTAVGTAPITYQWKKNGSNVGGATSPILSIASPNPTDAGSYTCVVTNAFGNSESNAATLSVVTNASCSDSVFCNGAESCLAGECVDNANPCAQACKESNDTCQPYGTMTCALGSASVPAGGSVNLDLFLSQVLDLAGYQVQVAVTPLTGSGTAAITCPGGITVDDVRSDYVFAGQQAFSTADCVNGLVAGASFTTVEVPLSPKYLATYSIDISSNAAVGSTFEVEIVPDPVWTTLLKDKNTAIPFNIGAPCIITVSECASVFGDVDAPLDGFVTLSDILCVLQGFANYSACPLGDLSPCFGNGLINLSDILWVLSAFSGEDFCCGGGGGASAEESWRDVRGASNEPCLRSDCTTLFVRDSQLRSARQDQLRFDIYIQDARDLKGFEISLDIRDSAGRVFAADDAFVDSTRADYIFHGDENFVAKDLTNGRLAGAKMTGGRDATTGYLGTFVVNLAPDMSRDPADYRITLRNDVTTLRDSALEAIPYNQRESKASDKSSR